MVEAVLRAASGGLVLRTVHPPEAAVFAVVAPAVGSTRETQAPSVEFPRAPARRPVFNVAIYTAPVRGL